MDDMVPSRTVDVVVTLDADVVEAARSLGVDLSASAGDGLADAVRAAKAAAWAEENAEALAQRRKRIEREGPKLARYRTF